VEFTPEFDGLLTVSFDIVLQYNSFEGQLPTYVGFCYLNEAQEVVPFVENPNLRLLIDAPTFRATTGIHETLPVIAGKEVVYGPCVWPWDMNGGEPIFAQNACGGYVTYTY
jgi:hypothetical protein